MFTHHLLELVEADRQPNLIGRIPQANLKSDRLVLGHVLPGESTSRIEGQIAIDNVARGASEAL